MDLSYLLCVLKQMIPLIFQNVFLITWLGNKQSHSDSSDVKCSIVEKRRGSKLFTVAMMGTRCLMHLMPLKSLPDA